MNPNDLLLWLSAKGSGSWARYRSAVDELQSLDEPSNADQDLDDGVPESGSLPVHLRLRLNLERLGHVEFFRDDFPDGWRIVPPTLACDDTGLQAVLCGARTDSLIRQVEDAIDGVSMQRSTQRECPDVIHVVVEEERHMQRVAAAADLYLQPRAVSQLLAAVPPIDDMQMRTPAELPFGTEWDASEFIAEKLGWISVEADKARAADSGLFRFHIHFQPHYFVKLRGRSFRIPVQVGKYLMLRKARQRVTTYDRDAMVFAVPVACRPPLLIDRALTLCTGRVPEVDKGHLIYRNVGNDKAIAVRALLRQ